MKLNGSKDNTIYYKKVKVKKKHLHTENYEEFNYNIKLFVHYGLSTVRLKKNQNVVEKHLLRIIGTDFFIIEIHSVED